MSHVLIADSDFLNSVVPHHPHPVLLNFSASWCGPCKGMAPHLEAFAASHAGVLTVAKVDVDQHKEVAAKFMIRSVPTLVLLQAGNVLATRTGAQTQEKLKEFVDPHLSNS